MNFDTLSGLEQRVAMLSVFILSTIFIMVASGFGIPLSATHTVVAALIGVGTITVGFENINPSKLRKILIFWAVSPVMAGIICVAFYLALKRLLRNTMKPSIRIATMVVLGAFVFGVMYILVVQILVKDLFTDATENKIYWIFLVPVMIFGFLLVRFSILIQIYEKKFCKAFGHALMFWEYKDMLKATE